MFYIHKYGEEIFLFYSILYRYIGYFEDDLPVGKGKYKFDMGSSLHGSYTTHEVVAEDPNNEDDEPTVYLKSVWKTEGKMTVT